MARFFEEVQTAVRASACAVLSANEFINGAIGTVSPGSRDFFNDYVNKTRRLIGCTSPDIQPPDPPFVGGQCPGVSYQIQYGAAADVFNCSGTFLSDRTRSFGNVSTPRLGPIGAIRVVGANPTNCGFGNYNLRVERPDGSLIFQSNNIFSPGVTGNARMEITSFTPAVVRVDALPDDCGSLPPVYPPPTTINIDIDIDYDDDDGNPINITIPFIFAPIKVNFDGSLEIPFSFDFGGFTFDGTLDLGPDFDVDINLPPLPRGEGQGTDVLPPGDPENEVDPEEGREKIIGVVVSSTIDAQSNLTNIATTNMPNIVAPRLGSVKFAYSVGVSTFWSNDIDVKGQRVFIPCPFSQGADAAVASPVPGVSMSFVEIRGYPLATTNDL